jgi:phosphomannomutase
MLHAYSASGSSVDNGFLLMNHILFDMDGTLTDPRQQIDPTFKDQLIHLCGTLPCHVVTGSDYVKVYEQLGKNLCTAFHTIYACNGNVAYRDNRIVWWSDAKSWKLTKPQIKLLKAEVERSKFWLRSGNHIEQRIGCANFSVVGRGASQQDRGYYRFWDKAHGERQEIVDRLRKKKAFSDVEMVLGGETGIDIYPKGYSKAQVRPRLPGTVLFVGDRCEPGGNDYEIAQACDKFYHVKNWQETRNLFATEAL